MVDSPLRGESTTKEIDLSKPQWAGPPLTATNSLPSSRKGMVITRRLTGARLTMAGDFEHPGIREDLKVEISASSAGRRTIEST